MKDKVVMITGGSAGIGAALAWTCAGRGAKLVLLARREGALAEVAARCETETLTVPTDVTRRADLERAVAAAPNERDRPAARRATVAGGAARAG